MDCDYLKDFIVPENMLDQDWTVHSSLLLLFPVEILLKVFPYLDRADAVCLALTCKRFLQVSSLVRLKVPCAVQHRQNKIPGCCETIKLLRQVQSPGLDWRLCLDCLSWRFEDSSGRSAEPVYGSRSEAWKTFVSDCARCVKMAEDVPRENSG